MRKSKREMGDEMLRTSATAGKEIVRWERGRVESHVWYRNLRVAK